MSKLLFAFSMAKRNLGRRRFRSALTILGIIVAITTVVSISMVMLGLQQEVTNIVNEIIGPSLIVRTGQAGIPGAGSAFPEIPESISYIIEKIPEVEGAYPTIEFIAEINGYTTLVQGIREEDLQNIYSDPLESGTSFRPGVKSVILSHSVADQLGVKVNDTVIIVPKRGVGAGTGEPFLVVGILKDMGPLESYIGSLIRLETAQQLTGYQGYVSRIMVRVKDPTYTNYIKAEIERMFPQVDVRSQEDILSNVNELLSNVNVVLVALGSISTIVGAIGVMNTVLTSVYERTREIGILKAVGAENTHILLVFLTESLLMGLIGGTLGAILGTGLTYALKFLISKMLLGVQVPIVFSPEIYIAGILIAVLISEAASLYPAWKAANTRPVEALRFG